MRTATIDRYHAFGTRGAYFIGVMHRGIYLAHLDDDYPALWTWLRNQGFTHWRNRNVKGRPHAILA